MIRLRAALFATAMAGNITMLIFLAKCYLGLSDRGGESADDSVTHIIFNIRHPKDHAAVKITRYNTPARRTLGEYYAVRDGGVANANIDLESYGRAHSVLAQHEHLSDE